MRNRENLWRAGLVLALLLFTGAALVTAQPTVSRFFNTFIEGTLTVGTGNIVVGNGTPAVTLNGEDLYVEGTSEFDGAMRVDGNVTFNGTTNLGLSAFGTGIELEGATADAFETTLAVTDPTADRTITLPDASGNVAVRSRSSQ